MRSKTALISLVTLTLAACASAPPKESTATGSTSNAKAEPTYSEKVGAVTVDQLRVSECPATGWEAADWRKLVDYANACVKAKDWMKVEKLGNHLAIRHHLTPWGPYYMSLSATTRKDYPRAIWMLELALKKAPQEGLFHYQLGRISWETGDDANAVKELKLASELNPSLVEAHNLMGMLALQKQDFSAAERSFNKALAADGNHWPSMLGLASVKMKTGEWKEVEDLLAKSVRANPRSSKARLALAQVQEQHLKKLTEALHSYKELKSLATDKKLDEGLKFNLDEKIQSLEKSLSQAQKVNQVTTLRKPAEQRKVAK